MRIEINTKKYNSRRYGLPWIALLDFSENLNGNYTFGSFIGDPGDPGILVISAEPGDILVVGQKDHRVTKRRKKYIAPQYMQVGEKGEIIHISGKKEAYLLFFERHGGQK